jgi:sugar-specific transcriptional regulator TrmB|tara:strand:- start:573 stop:917 length:345 start_codon:yes stop_codon:yes gene_type:complete
MSWENTLKKKLELNEEEMMQGFGKNKKRLTPEELKKEAQRMLDEYEKFAGALSDFTMASPFVFAKDQKEINEALDRIVERLEDTSGLTAEMEEEARQEMSHPDYIDYAMRNDPY